MESIIKLIAFVIGILILIIEFIQLSTNLHWFTVESIIGGTTVGVLLIVAPILTIYYFGTIIVWGYFAYHIITFASKTFGIGGALIALIASIYLPFYLYRKYEKNKTTKANKDTPIESFEYQKTDELKTITENRSKRKNEQIQIIQNQKKIPNIDFNLPKLTESKEEKIVSKDYGIANLNWYRNEEGIHSDYLQEFYPNGDFEIINSSSEVVVRYKKKNYYIPFNSIMNFEKYNYISYQTSILK